LLHLFYIIYNGCQRQQATITRLYSAQQRVHDTKKTEEKVVPSTQ